MSTEAKANTEEEQEVREWDAEQKQPLLQEDEDLSQTALTRNKAHDILSQTLQGAANLANLLPTGTLLMFQLIVPIFTNQGDCDYLNRVMTSALLVLSALALFLLNITDSVRFGCGNLAYGFATINGLWLVDSEVQLPPRLASRYRLRIMDFVHGFTSVLVFMAIGLSENNTVKCFFPSPSRDQKQILSTLPVGIGVISSFLFARFPTQRHSIGYTRNAR